MTDSTSDGAAAGWVADAGAHHSPRERYLTYWRGFRDGVGATVHRHPGYRDYERGYHDGSVAVSKARWAFAAEVGHDPSADMLRSAPAEGAGK